jgi:hypothetical protein
MATATGGAGSRSEAGRDSRDSFSSGGEGHQKRDRDRGNDRGGSDRSGSNQSSGSSKDQASDATEASRTAAGSQRQRGFLDRLSSVFGGGDEEAKETAPSDYTDEYDRYTSGYAESYMDQMDKVKNPSKFGSITDEGEIDYDTSPEERYARKVDIRDRTTPVGEEERRLQEDIRRGANVASFADKASYALGAGMGPVGFAAPRAIGRMYNAFAGTPAEEAGQQAGQSLFSGGKPSSALSVGAGMLGGPGAATLTGFGSSVGGDVAVSDFNQRTGYTGPGSTVKDEVGGDRGQQQLAQSQQTTTPQSMSDTFEMATPSTSMYSSFLENFFKS